MPNTPFANVFSRPVSPSGLMRTVCGTAPLLWLTAVCPAQSVTFSRPTDTIAFVTACLPNPMAETRELRFSFEGPQPSGSFYNEHQSFFFDRQFGITPTSVYEYSHPIDSGVLWEVPVTVTPGDWHHLAFCYDGANESMYLDGARIGTRPRAGAISPGCGSAIGGVAALGWIRRTDSSEISGAPVTMDWFRVSSAVRYTGETYAVPSEPTAADADTQLLYTFDECESSSTVHDRSSLGRTGELGGAGGTSPHLSSRVYANCDQSSTAPVLNVNDFLCFQTRFAAGDSYANCDGSTAPPVLNVNDFLCFQTRFAAGC